MKIDLKQLSLNCSKEEYKMLQNVRNNENGFYNPVYEKSYEEYVEWLQKEEDYSKGKNYNVPTVKVMLKNGGEIVDYSDDE